MEVRLPPRIPSAFESAELGRDGYPFKPGGREAEGERFSNMGWPVPRGAGQEQGPRATQGPGSAQGPAHWQQHLRFWRSARVDRKAS